MRRLLVTRLLPLAAIAAAACATTPPEPCPGVPVATLSWSATRDDAGTTCTVPVAQPSLSFRATVALEDGAAALCVARPQATPLSGTRADAAFTVGSIVEGVTVGGCGCPVTLTETVAGTLLGEDPARPSGFAGRLVDRLEVAPGADPSGCTCALPCEIAYELSAAP